MTSQNKQWWEDEFDDETFRDNDLEFDRASVKRFMKAILTTQKQMILERLPSEKGEPGYRTPSQIGHNNALSEVRTVIENI